MVGEARARLWTGALSAASPSPRSRHGRRPPARSRASRLRRSRAAPLTGPASPPLSWREATAIRRTGPRRGVRHSAPGAAVGGRSRGLKARPRSVATRGVHRLAWTSGSSPVPGRRRCGAPRRGRRGRPDQALARAWRLRSCGSRKRLRRRMALGVTSTSSSSSM